MLVVLDWGVVRREERYLEAIFGETYRVYRTQVRRWL
jgi:protein-S-isoprenylcysteine O-methyltransferase Ste14